VLAGTIARTSGLDWTTSTASATQASRSLDAAMTNVTSTRRLARSHSALVVNRRGSSSAWGLEPFAATSVASASPTHEGGPVRDPGGSKASGREIANADERRDQLSGVRAMPHDEDGPARTRTTARRSSRATRYRCPDGCRGARRNRGDRGRPSPSAAERATATRRRASRHSASRCTQVPGSATPRRRRRTRSAGAGTFRTANGAVPVALGDAVSAQWPATRT
jgi:hypothetical protein